MGKAMHTGLTVNGQIATLILLGIHEVPTLTASSQHYEQEHSIFTLKKRSVLLKVKPVVDQSVTRC